MDELRHAEVRQQREVLRELELRRVGALDERRVLDGVQRAVVVELHLEHGRRRLAHAGAPHAVGAAQQHRRAVRPKVGERLRRRLGRRELRLRDARRTVVLERVQ